MTITYLQNKIKPGWNWVINTTTRWLKKLLKTNMQLSWHECKSWNLHTKVCCYSDVKSTKHLWEIDLKLLKVTKSRYWFTTILILTYSTFTNIVLRDPRLRYLDGLDHFCLTNSSLFMLTLIPVRYVEHCKFSKLYMPLLDKIVFHYFCDGTQMY